MLETLPTEKMALFLRILAFVVFLQAFFVGSFLLNTNTSDPLPSSGQTSGSDANAFIYLLQKVDNLQLQIHQQSKTMEEQNKTLDAQNKRIEAQTKLMEAQNKTMEEQSKALEAQKSVIQELLNFTRQTPSTVSLSNDLSILEMHVRRIMDEYQRLSNISDTTDLVSKINSVTNSVRVLTSLFTSQENKVDQMDHDFKQHVSTLNESLLSVSNRVSQNERDTSSHFSSISSSLSRLNTDMAVMKTRVGFTAGVTLPSSSWLGDILVFPHVVTNTGNCYNNNTGKFTAPRTGTYVFFVTAVSYDRYFLSLDIVHNHAVKVRTWSDNSAAWQTGTNLAVLKLSQGDTVWVRRSYGQGYNTHRLFPLTTFSGFLL